MKDLFSSQAALYARYRPTYPAELYEYILGFVDRKDAALDCATGNGQVARSLAPHFQKVYAIDISERQLQFASRGKNIEYSVSPAESTPFRDNSFDLITVAQAYHWINGARFCNEATRIAKTGGIVAIWVYDTSYGESDVDQLVRHWNFDILAPFWEEERKHVYTHYQHLPFDFEPIPVRDFRIDVDWSYDDLMGHLGTWSALQNMKRQQGDAAFLQIAKEIRNAWGNDQKKKFVFPVVLKLGRVRK